MKKEKDIKKILKTSIVFFSLLTIINCIRIMSSSNAIFEKSIDSKNNISFKASKMQYDFDYTGTEQTFTVPTTGTYKLETWGAQGGPYNTSIGGYGGYSEGTLSIEKETILYINVGGSGIANNGSVSVHGGIG